MGIFDDPRFRFDRDATVEPAPAPPPELPTPQNEAHQRSQADFYARWGLQGKDSLWLPNTVEAVARIDRDWQEDDQRLWAYTTAQLSTIGPNEFPAVAIFAGTRRCLVRKIEVLLQQDTATFGPTIGGRFHLARATDPTIYNPVANNGGEFFPFLNSDPEISVPGARCVGGTSPTLPSVTINGVPVAPALGPAWEQEGWNWATNLNRPTTKTLLDWSDPPLIVPPNGVVYVQHYNSTFTAIEILNVNWWLTERVVA